MEGSIFIFVIIFGLVIWFLLIYIVSKYGEKRRLGFLWTLIAALLLSPFLAFILAAISGRK
ncbi:MAG: hypothetical protein M3421_16165 [Bacteroidota bacterium]|jgi:heme/copper-type cytochrome/quinol oxidase subunit 2|nr:hypothetical protein [Bacteroidota bacterium]